MSGGGLYKGCDRLSVGTNGSRGGVSFAGDASDDNGRVKDDWPSRHLSPLGEGCGVTASQFIQWPPTAGHLGTSAFPVPTSCHSPQTVSPDVRAIIDIHNFPMSPLQHGSSRMSNGYDPHSGSAVTLCAGAYDRVATTSHPGRPHFPAAVSTKFATANKRPLTGRYHFLDLPHILAVFHQAQRPRTAPLPCARALPC